MQSSADIFYSFPRVIDLSLERMKFALAKIALNLPPIIHIAGTNGKGSSLAFLRAILESAGKKCHVYTSPHLVTIHERYVIAGEQISENALLQYALKVKEIASEIPLTIFEAETLAGFLAFSDTKADYLLLETGLGGRLDATNAIDDKALTIITPIDYDHKEFLGEDLGQIAREKCGILRKDVPVIVGRQRDGIFEIIEDEAQKLNAPTKFLGRDFDAFMSYGKFCFQTDAQFFELPNPSLSGVHQFDNAACAIMAALSLGVDEGAIANGIANAKWSARMQNINFGKFGEMAKENGCELWLDGCHNPHGANAAAGFIANLQKQSPRELILICGLLANKDANGFFDAFAPLKPITYCAPIQMSPNGESPEALANIAAEHALSAQTFANIETAIQTGTQNNGARIIICGSLYLAGEVLGKN
ncbi:MAG: bifunctional folylpolyglutamate synthase/dihydrofolate synthase [Caulobacterales bacterium]|nr:bifunctional folylpolyglutamate synthase/dihydrofolate synthase [Caulobacterales bacterium]MCA0371457.1 bifunctional folylpolyglutamate synthase/dihydrofolate synthase [Pseudomonadota bacterium]